MSTPPPPEGLPKTALIDTANALHSLSIRLLRRVRAADRRTGLSPERLSLLSVLVYAGPRNIGALAVIEGVSAPAISRIVTSLERDGLARRERGADAREVKVAATAKGKKIVDEGRRGRIALIAEELASLSLADRKALQKIAEILARLEMISSRK